MECPYYGGRIFVGGCKTMQVQFDQIATRDKKDEPATKIGYLVTSESDDGFNKIRIAQFFPDFEEAKKCVDVTLDSMNRGKDKE